MARMRARRRPLDIPRPGRLKNQIEMAFVLSYGEPLTTAELVERCYLARWYFGKFDWHRQNVRRAVAKYAVPCGHGLGRGRPFLWRPINSNLKFIPGSIGSSTGITG